MRLLIKLNTRFGLCLTILFISLFTLINPSTSSGQKLEGEIQYDYTTSWTKMTTQLTFLSNEQKERMKMTWGEETYTNKTVMYFTPSKTFYTHYQDPNERENWWQKDYFITNDLDAEKAMWIVDVVERPYVIEDSLRNYKWRILNQIKEVAGHLCMLAETEDPIKKQKIKAWFAQDLPVGGGPEMYYGLPGMILELDVNDGTVVVSATKINMGPIEDKMKLPKKIKGKKITLTDYDKLVDKHIKDSIKSQRNPYWTLRY